MAQLRATLRSIAATADERVAELEARVEQNAGDDLPFPDRRGINQISLRFQLDHERLIGDWARWALEQTAGWRSPTDPGRWTYRHTDRMFTP